jgi:hypothetical protein
VRPLLLSRAFFESLRGVSRSFVTRACKDERRVVSLSYPRGMVALDPASVLLDGQPLGAFSTGALVALGVQGSVLSVCAGRGW